MRRQIMKPKQTIIFRFQAMQYQPVQMNLVLVGQSNSHDDDDDVVAFLDKMILWRAVSGNQRNVLHFESRIIIDSHLLKGIFSN